MTAVKICGLTNLPDARWAWECGADLLGFISVPASRHYVRAAEVAPITAALRREGCPARLVGVFANESVDDVRRTVAACGLDVAQLHGGESPDYVAELGVPAIVARPMTEGVSWAKLKDYDAWGYLLDTHDPQRLGGTGRTWDWRRLDDLHERPPRLIIAGGLTPENVADAVRRTRPWGVDVASGVEASPRRKDPEKVAAFIRSVREEDRHATS